MNWYFENRLNGCFYFLMIWGTVAAIFAALIIPWVLAGIVVVKLLRPTPESVQAQIVSLILAWIGWGWLVSRWFDLNSYDNTFQLIYTFAPPTILPFLIVATVRLIRFARFSHRAVSDKNEAADIRPVD